MRKECPPLRNKVAGSIRRQGLIPRGCTVVAGVSGGPDSVALLAVLASLRQEFGFSLTAVHVHHGIRGLEADQDEELVRSLCEKLRVPFRAFHYDVPALAKERRLGIEEMGRLLRREAFQSVAAQQEGPEPARIALAHHRGDQAETVLFHLCRGSGLRGLSGIRPASGAVIHPFLDVSREEILTYLNEEGLPWRTDSSNLEFSYTRNRIRGHVLPLLEVEVHPGSLNHIAQAADRMAEAEECLEELARELLKSCLITDSIDTSLIRLRLENFSGPRLLRLYALRAALEGLPEGGRELSAAHLSGLLELTEGGAGRRLSLPDGISAENTGKELWLRAGNEMSRNGVSGFGPRLLPEEGEVQIPGGRFLTRVFAYGGEPVPRKKYTKWFDYDKIGESPVCRCLESGDALRILPNLHRKPVRRVMIDEKVPASLRGTVPVIAEEAHVMWLVGIRTDDGYRVEETTGRVLEICFIPEEKGSLYQTEPEEDDHE